MSKATRRLPFVCKPGNLAELTDRVSEASVYPARIVETIDLTTAEFDAFASDFFADQVWLAGKGGGGAVTIHAVEVRAPNRPRLLVNPEGYAYARYVAILEPESIDSAASAIAWILDNRDPNITCAEALKKLRFALHGNQQGLAEISRLELLGG